MAPSLWPHAHIVSDRWRFIGETEVPQALCSTPSPSLPFPFHSSFYWHTAYLCLYCNRTKRRKRKRGKKGGKKGAGSCSPTSRQIQMKRRHSKHGKWFQKLAYLYILLPHSLPSCLPHAYSNTRFGFDTNSCHLVQFTSKGRMMCIIRKAKNSRERRCFKVPEFDSSERLLVCVWGGTFVLCETETG